jgi:hypothetical protein
MKNKKEKYLVKVNWSGEILEYYTRVFNEEQAKRNVIVKVANAVGYTRYYVRQRLTQFEIKRITE